MKPDYKNWVPRGMILGFFVMAVLTLCLLFLVQMTDVFAAGVPHDLLTVIFLVLTVVFAFMGSWMLILHAQFSYHGKRQMSKQIISGTAAYVVLPDGGRGLDVGCGSGALTIACAKRNPKAKMLGVDRWGKEYASFSRQLCEDNAEAEHVANVSFENGNALNLPFADESFDAVCSNYVYHNIPSRDRQTILLETLRVLKKGGTFAIHDIFSRARYGDMQSFVQKLKDMGYEQVRLIPTTNGMFMTKSESVWMGLSGSALLVGKK